MSNRRVIFSPAFTHAFKQLQKRYRWIGDELCPLVDQLRSGATPGYLVQGVGYWVDKALIRKWRTDLPSVLSSGIGYRLYKVRIRSTDAKGGKSGGNRIVYYLETADKVILITICTKPDQIDMHVRLVLRLVQEYEANQQSGTE